jgi:drug/metabolite transporter (DMT)-like permease
MGWFFLALVVLGFIATNFFMKLGSLKGYPSPALTGSLFAEGALLCLIFLLSSGQPILSSKPVVLLAVAGGAAGAVAYFLFLSALRIGNYALTIATYTMSFLIPVAFSILFWDRALSRWITAGLLGIAAGIVMISTASSSTRDRQSGLWLKWISFLGAAFLLNGVPQVAQAAAARLGRINLWYFLFLTFLSGAVVFGLFYLVRGVKPHRAVFSFGALAAAGSVAGNLFILKSLATLPEAVVFPVALAGPVIGAVLLSILFFREKIRPLGYLGMIVGLAGIILLTLK